MRLKVKLPALYAFFHRFLPFIVIVIFISCQTPEQNKSVLPLKINTNHLDHLYEEIEMENGDTVGIIHIYCEYPDYNYVGDDDEGIACVDDAARAAIFYLRHYKYNGIPASKHKARNLIRFLLNMQSENGYFYNFIWPDYTIHTEGKTTRHDPEWWSWRTLWTFGEAIPILPEGDPLLAEIRISRDILVRNIVREIALTEEYDTTAGLAIPKWLPHSAASDQAALIILGLTSYYTQTKDTIAEKYIHHLAKGMMQLKVENEGTFPHGAFLSWKNLWHAYGNSQAYALLIAGSALKSDNLIKSALEELDHFIPELLEQGGYHHFYVAKSENRISIKDKTILPQIAYDYRPMIWACLEAWKITKEQKYLDLAKRAGRWFEGNNMANTLMYDPQTGRGYDGIISASKINRNAGAESTIEALLALQELERVYKLNGLDN